MNVPYWLLRLLPMWEFICPKCRKGVKQSTHQCPYCGERFPLTVRVPPSFLKDPKRLEAYVHKHVFPRVSEFERNYLTKYFTEIFRDGQVGTPQELYGDFSAWTTTYISVFNIEVSNTYSHHGTYSLKVTTVETSGYALAEKTLSIPSLSFARVYIRLTALPPSGRSVPAFTFLISGGTDEECIQIYNDAGTYKFRISHIVSTSRVFVLSDSIGTISADVWYCVEFEFYLHATNGYEKAYLNGELKYDSGELRNNSYFGTTRSYFRVGANAYGDGDECVWANNYYVDCVVVADAYIGPEAEGGQPYISRVQRIPGMMNWGGIRAFQNRFPIPVIRRF